ncbi:phage protein Gp27 family protein [Paenibacillus tyrfis]|uniref:DUF3486 family protein n=1 Tax=Paenibacillus tyrfis TaxID=1501230 RepID=A0A081NY97_9BACL|nr:phage protein Gp27 family protein [Paenibacillus tyrfis]KEQ23420.1 hypothetical protein ET33_16440 [Paenibacillus tyrfis]
MSSRRKHSKVLQLPPEIVEAVNKKLTTGTTYREIADWINQMAEDTGVEISHMSVQRYGKDFLSRLERLKVVNEQAKAIVETHGEGPDTALAEAANKLALQLVMETLMTAQNTLEDEKLTNVMRALTQLQRSSVATEKLKFTFDKGISKAIDQVKQQLQEELKSDPDLYHRLAAIADRIESDLTAG